MVSIPYALVIGSLMYAMLCTRLDIAYSIRVSSRFQVNPGREHKNVVKCNFTYFRRIKVMVLVYGDGDLRVDNYINF